MGSYADASLACPTIRVPSEGVSEGIGRGGARRIAITHPSGGQDADRSTRALALASSLVACNGGGGRDGDRAHRGEVVRAGALADHGAADRADAARGLDRGSA